MARQEIDVGAVPNDDSGDPLRISMQKINAMTDEIYREEGGFRAVYCDPTATSANQDGSQAAPFESVVVAQNAVSASEANPGTVYLTAGDYPHFEVIELRPFVSFISTVGRGQAVIAQTIITENSNATFDTVSFDNALIVGNSVDSTDRIDLLGCTIRSGLQIRGGAAEADLFIYDLCSFDGSLVFGGSRHTIVGGSFELGSIIQFGDVAHAGVNTVVKIQGATIDSLVINVFNLVAHVLDLTILTTEINTPINFAGMDGVCNLTIDATSLGFLIDAGQNFDFPGLNITVIGLADFLFDDTIINSDINDVEFQDVCQLDLSGSNFLPGLYMLTITMLWTGVDNGESFQWQVSGGATIGNLQKQSIVPGDVETWTFSAPVVVPDLSTVITVEAMITGGTNAAIGQCSIALEQRKNS